MMKLLYVVLILLFLFTCMMESFQPYKRYPFGEVKTGNDPLYFYGRNRYRKPYRWPQRYYSSYPYPHLQPYP